MPALTFAAFASAGSPAVAVDLSRAWREYGPRHTHYVAMTEVSAVLNVRNAFAPRYKDGKDANIVISDRTTELGGALRLQLLGVACKVREALQAIPNPPEWVTAALRGPPVQPKYMSARIQFDADGMSHFPVLIERTSAGEVVTRKVRIDEINELCPAHSCLRVVLRLKQCTLSTDGVRLCLEVMRINVAFKGGSAADAAEAEYRAACAEDAGDTDVELDAAALAELLAELAPAAAASAAAAEGDTVPL